MKKTNLFAALCVALALTACDKSKTADVTATKSETAPAELKIAYVEVDSIMTQYQFCKDYTQILTKKGQNIESTIQKKGEALQSAVNNFQQKLQQPFRGYVLAIEMERLRRTRFDATAA